MLPWQKLRLYFFIAAQTASGAQPCYLNGVGDLGNLAHNKKYSLTDQN